MLYTLLGVVFFGPCALVHANDTVDGSSTQAYAGWKAPELKFDKDYSALELEKLWQNSLNSDHSNEATVALKGTSTAQESVSLSRRQHVAGYREQKAWLQMRSKCPVSKQDSIEFVVTVIYDTRNVLFKKGQNVDDFTSTTISGGRNHPLVSTAKFHHFACRPISKTTVCSYRYYGTIQAEVKYGRKDIGVSLLRSQEKAPYVMEDCVSTFPGGPALRCPTENGPAAVRCDLQEV